MAANKVLAPAREGFYDFIMVFPSVVKVRNCPRRPVSVIFYSFETYIGQSVRAMEVATLIVPFSYVAG